MGFVVGTVRFPFRLFCTGVQLPLARYGSVRPLFVGFGFAGAPYFQSGFGSAVRFRVDGQTHCRIRFC